MTGCVHWQSAIFRNSTSWKKNEAKITHLFSSLLVLFLLSLFLPLFPLSLPLFFSSPSIQLASDSAGFEEMDGESIFRTREGGQTKSKLGREREREGRREEGCEGKINLHSTAASGQRQLERSSRRSSITGRRHSITILKTHFAANRLQSDLWDCKSRDKKERPAGLDKDEGKCECKVCRIKACITIENAWGENTQAAWSVLEPRAAAVEPFLATVYQRCGLNLAMVTPWKKLGEAGILVCLALFLARRLRRKYIAGSTQGYNNMGLYK